MNPVLFLSQTYLHIYTFSFLFFFFYPNSSVNLLSYKNYLLDFFLNDVLLVTTVSHCMWDKTQTVCCCCCCYHHQWSFGSNWPYLLNSLSLFSHSHTRRVLVCFSTAILAWNCSGTQLCWHL